MKDRFFYGFIAGIIGGIVPLLISFGCKTLGLTTIVWVDFMSTFMLARRPANAAEIAFFIVIQFIFLGVLGAIFAMILPYISGDRPLFKGAVYGVTVWYILFSIPYLLQLHDLEKVPLKTAIVHSVISLLWGIALADVLKRLYNREAKA